jgi:hypothetical protein
VEWRAREEVVEFRGRDRTATNPEYPGLEPFDLTLLPDLFERLPDDRYRLYLYEDGTERLVLDFIIEQGQPVEAPELQQPELQQLEEQPAEDSDNIPELGNPGGNGVDATGNSDTDQDDTDRADDPVRSRLPVNPVPANPGLQEKGADLRQLQRNWLPESVNGRPMEASFAERFGRESVVSHGGLVITAAVLGHTAGPGKGGKHRENQSREKSVDRIIRRFGLRRPMAGKNVR